MEDMQQAQARQQEGRQQRARQGGLARARALTAARRQEIARQAAYALHARGGCPTLWTAEQAREQGQKGGQAPVGSRYRAKEAS